MLGRHCTEAGLIERAASLWGKAGQRSVARSALVEAEAQITRALVQIATLPGTPALRSEQIKFQVALITPLMHVKGFAAPEPKAAAERARVMIEQAEAPGERPDDPLLLFSVLYGIWVAKFVGFDGAVCRDLAVHFVALAEKQGDTVPIMVAQRLMGPALLFSGDIAEARAHLDRGIALYDPAEHRSLAARFAVDIRVGLLFFPVDGSVVARLSRRRARGRAALARRHARDRRPRKQDKNDDGRIRPSAPPIRRSTFATVAASHFPAPEGSAAQTRKRLFRNRSFRGRTSPPPDA
jgi:hypothetical protein